MPYTPEPNALTIDLSLRNSELYAGCAIEEVAGRLNLVTPVEEAVNLVGRNIHGIVASTPPERRNEVILTGPMAVWSYLVVFHAVVHAFRAVWYNDGRGTYLLAKHG